MAPDRFLRIVQVCELTALSKAEIYRRIQKGSFPKQIRISHKYAAWRMSDVSGWMQQQVANVG